MFNLVDVGWFLRLSRGTFQSVIDSAVRGAAPAQAIALSYKVKVAVAVETARNKWIQYEFCTQNKTCRSYTNALHKHFKYWIRETSEQRKFAALICTRMQEKQAPPDKLINHSLSWIVPVCGLDNKKWWDWGSSPTCVTTSRCYLQLKSLSGQQ